MSWKDAKAEAERWIIDAGISADLRGRTLALPVFTTDEDCAFFAPGRGAQFHRMIVDAVSRLARKGGATVSTGALRPEDYRAWLAAGPMEDSGTRRAKYFREQTRLV